MSIETLGHGGEGEYFNDINNGLEEDFAYPLENEEVSEMRENTDEEDGDDFENNEMEDEWVDDYDRMDDEDS